MKLAEVLDWLWAAEPPAPVAAKARELVLDTVGCVLAARAKPQVQALAERLDATSLFAMAACWDEACEGLARAHGRPGVPVIAACISFQGSLAAFLRAVIVGYEVGARLGEVLRIAPGLHVDGYWPGLGVAAGVVRLRGGTAAQALAAVRIAACQLPRSLYLPVSHGSEARNTYLAHSAQLGILAANAALAGIDAPASLNTGELAAPGEWLILEGYLKPFAAVRHVHYGVSAALALRPSLDLKRIGRIELHIYEEALTYCANRAPTRPIQAQFSLSYGLAHALVAGELSPAAYTDEALNDPLTVALEKKVHLIADKAMTGRGARLVIDGDPQHSVDELAPMSREEVIAKFMRYSGLPRAAALGLLAASGERPLPALLAELASPP